MKKIILIIVAILGLSTVISGFSSFNSIQIKDESVARAWSDLDSTLQRRSDLIPNLVSTVQAYAKHEKQTLTDVIEARANASKITINSESMNNPENVALFNQSQDNLSKALGKLMVVVEKYPDLKANQNFRDLQHQLEGTENRINVARQTVNKEVAEFNSQIRTFPNNMVNKFTLNLDKKVGFAAKIESKENPIVKFDL